MDFSIYEAKIRDEIKPRFVVDTILKIIKDHKLIPTERLPHKGETVAIVNSYPKTAALLYDKLLCVYGEGAPEEISVIVHTESFFRQVLSDICAYFLDLDSNHSEHKIDDDNLSNQIREPSVSEYLIAHIAGFKFGVINKYFDLKELLREREETGNNEQFLRRGLTLFNKFVLRWHSESLWAEYKISATPIYCTLHDRDIVYNPGDYSAICASLLNLEIVNEKELEWDQVIDFRRDAEASIKYRRFINWLDRDMVGKSQGFIENEIAIRLDEYKWAINKHGIKTVIGTISHVLDSKFLLSSAAASGAVAWMAEPIDGLFAMGGITIGKVAIQIARTRLAIKEEVRNTNPEISYVHDIGKITNKVQQRLGFL